MNVGYGPHDDRIMFCFLLFHFHVDYDSHVSWLQLFMNATQRRSSVFVTFRHLQVESSWTTLRPKWDSELASFEAMFSPRPYPYPSFRMELRNGFTLT